MPEYYFGNIDKIIKLISQAELDLCAINDALDCIYKVGR
jgi:hypothetical protein